MPKPLPKTEAYRSNRKSFLQARKQGWSLFSGASFRPCEQRLVQNAFKIVIKTGIGMDRKIAGTSEAVRRIVPFVAMEITEELKGKISAKDIEVFSALIERLTGHLTIDSATGEQPKSLIELRNSISEQGQKAINSAALKLSVAFSLLDEKRPEARNDPYNFRKNLEFQIKHDIFFAITEIRFLISRKN